MIRLRPTKALNAIALAIVIVASVVVPASAATPTYGSPGMYDNSPARDRLLIDPSYPKNVVYLSVPVYMPLPGRGYTSLSTPTYSNGAIFQYAYSGTRGYLFSMRYPSVNGASFLASHPLYTLPPDVVTKPTYAHSTLVFSPGSSYSVAGQDELSVSQGWASIAVGRDLYSWPVNQWPTSADLSRLSTRVWGNPGNSQWQIDENPLVTPPVAVSALDLQTGTMTTLHVPMAVVGSRDGGLVAQPLGVPSTDVVDTSPLHYMTTMDYASDAGTPLTSDPTWVGKCSIGPDCVAFGVASPNHPRVELFDLSSGRHKAVGVGVVGAPITDTITLDAVGAQATAPVLFAHDIYGTTYAFNLSGRLVDLWKYGTSPTPEYAKDATIVYDPQFSTQTMVATVGNGASESWQYPANPKFASVGAPGYTGLTSPTTLVGAGGISYLVFSYQGYRNLVRSYGPGIQIAGGNAGTNFVNQGRLSNFQIISAPTQSYVGVTPDVGSTRFMVTYTNSSPVGPAVELLMPVQYAVRSTLSATTVPSAGAVTVFGRPIPSSVTNDAGQNPDRFGVVQGQGVESPMYAQLVPQAGSGLSTIIDRMVQEYPADPQAGHAWSAWYTQGLNLPANDTGKPIRWTVTVTTVDKFGDKATSSPMALVEEPGTSPPPPSGGPGLRLNPNPSLWAQTISATLSPTAPSLPSGETLVRWQISSATLSYPKKNPDWAFSFPYYPVPSANSVAMTTSGHTATAQFMEDFWNGGCHTQVPGACTWINNQAYSLNLPGAGSLYPYSSTIPSDRWTVTATYQIVGTESHVVVTTTTDKATGKTITTRKTVTSPFTSTGTAQATLTVDGTAKDVVGGG